MDDQQMARRIEGLTFSATRLRPGYDMGEVDDFLQMVAGGLRNGSNSLTGADIRGATFTTTRLRTGYDEEEVDAFLDELERFLHGS